MVVITHIDGLARSEAARELNRSGVWLDTLAREGRIGYIQTPLGKVFPREEVERIKALMSRKNEQELKDAA